MSYEAKPPEVQIHCCVCGQIFHGDRELKTHLVRQHGVSASAAMTAAEWSESACYQAKRKRLNEVDDFEAMVRAGEDLD